MKLLWKILFAALTLFALSGIVYALSTSNFGNVVVNGNATFSGTWVNVSGTLTTTNLVATNLESNLDGTGYNFTGNIIVPDDATVTVGSSTDSYFEWDTIQATANTIVWWLGSVANSFIFGDITNVGKDYDHVGQANPTLFVHSATSPDTNNTQWVSLTHDTASAVLDSGTDQIVLDDTTYVAGDIVVGDPVVGTEMMNIYEDGTYLHMNVTRDLSINDMFIFNITNGHIILQNGAEIYDNATCMILESPAGTGKTTVCD